MTALVDVTDHIYDNMDKSLLTGIVYLDLKKAFDTVNPEVLLHKLTWIGVKDTELAWFTNYLIGCQQRVNHGGITSESMNISYGVPQGSILGPLLFIFFMNDLPQCIKECKIGLYADDTVLIYAAKTASDVKLILQQDLALVSNWLKHNRLHLNVKKTKWSFIGTHQKLARAQDMDLSINGQPLVKVDEYKYLGMYFDKNLNWHFHIDKMCSKISQRTGLLKRVKYFVPNQTLKMLYNALVLPLFDYGNVIYSTTDQTYLKRLQTLQNKGARLILNCHFRTHVKDMLKSLNWMNVKDRAGFHRLCLMYKTKNGLTPEYLSDKLTTISDIHSHNTRSSKRNDMATVKPKNNQQMRTFQYIGAKSWNDTDPTIREKSSLNAFKSAYLKEYFSQL